MYRRRIITAREQHEMLSPWLHRAAFVKEARYPQEWRGEAPYGRLPSGRPRNRPPSVLRDLNDPDAGIIDPSEIRYEHDSHDSVSAYHPNGDHLGNYEWEENNYGGPTKISTAQVNPKYQGQGVGGGIIDHIRENYHPDLVHSGYQGRGSLSYQGRAAALRDLGNTEQEHNDYFNTRPYNYGSPEPSGFGYLGRNFTDAQRRAHIKLMQQYEEDRRHPNYTGNRSNPGDEEAVQYGYGEEGYNADGFNRDGYDRDGYDRDGYDKRGFSRETGLNRAGKTQHGYTPGDGTPPPGTVPMSQMKSHWEQNGLPTSKDHRQMMDNASVFGIGPSMYAVRHPGDVSPDSGGHHVGNGDTLYSSLERARQVAYHPDDPSKDKNIVFHDDIDPAYLHTDASGKAPEDFHYSPDSRVPPEEVGDATSTPAWLFRDPVRHQRILNDLGSKWSLGTFNKGQYPGFKYTDPNSGRSGIMYQHYRDGTWHTRHEPEFGRLRRKGQYQNYRDAARAIEEGTLPGPTMDQHALEINNDHEASGGGSVNWQPHPNGRGLTATTPHRDLHLVQDPDNGQWEWQAGSHGSQPGDEGNVRGPRHRDERLSDTAASAVRVITRHPFLSALDDKLGEGWGHHPTAWGAYTRRLPSGNHAFVKQNPDGMYTSGIQRDNGRGQPYAAPIAVRNSHNLAEVLAFIDHRENRVPGNTLGEGWEDLDMGRHSFPTYIHENHPSGSKALLSWWPQRNRWRVVVSPRNGNSYDSLHKTPQEAASWANGEMDKTGTSLVQ